MTLDPKQFEDYDPVIRAAKIEVMLMTEFMPDERPDWEDATWVCNVKSPSQEGIDRLQAVQQVYGSVNVTTGNAKPLAWDEVGIYVRDDVLEDTPNFLREYLAR